MQVTLNEVDSYGVLNCDLLNLKGELLGTIGDVFLKLKNHYSAIVTDVEFHKLVNNEFATAKRIYHYV